MKVVERERRIIETFVKAITKKEQAMRGLLLFFFEKCNCWAKLYIKPLQFLLREPQQLQRWQQLLPQP